MSNIITNEYLITNRNIITYKRMAYLSDVHSDITKLEEVVKTLKDLEIRILL